jgi:hypothetical protein
MKDERQKKPRAGSQKMRLVQERRSSQAITLSSGLWRPIVRVGFPVQGSRVIVMIFSLKARA